MYIAVNHLQLDSGSFMPFLYQKLATGGTGSVLRSDGPDYCRTAFAARPPQRRKAASAAGAPRPITPPWIKILKDNERRVRKGPSDVLYMASSRGSISRLGNQLSQYASLFGIAWRNGRVPLWSDGPSQARDYFNTRFVIDRNNSIHENPVSNFTSFVEVEASVYDNRTESLPKRNITLVGCYHSWKYFQEVEDQLRVDLTFKDDVIQKAENFLNSTVPDEWRGLDFVRVFIHVRRTDLAINSSVEWGWPIASSEYFNRSMDYFRQCLQRVQFVVLSDDIWWCKKNVLGPDVVYSVGNQPVVDMAIASLCDHAIISAGSFGMWAAWFADGVTITQKDLPLPGSLLDRTFRREDFYKPHYIAM
jgi:galactoside 2-L-fucosyltransferase 1/2